MSPKREVSIKTFYANGWNSIRTSLGRQVFPSPDVKSVLLSYLITCFVYGPNAEAAITLQHKVIDTLWAYYTEDCE